MLAHTIAKMAHRRVEVDLERFEFRQDAEVQGTLGRRVDDMAQVLRILAKTTWLDELAAETADRPEAEELPQASSVEAAPSRNYTFADLKLIPRPPIGFYVPPAVVKLLEGGLIAVGQIFTVNGRDFRVRRNSETGEMALWFALRGG